MEEKEEKEGEEKEGGDGRYPSPNNMRSLMPAEKMLLVTKLESCRPKEQKQSPKTKCNGAAPAHTRSEVRRKRGRGNVAIDEKSPHGCR
jgi:hypothetical protein